MISDSLNLSNIEYYHFIKPLRDGVVGGTINIGRDERMETVLTGLEITPEQRAPGLRNPLRPQQVKHLMRGWGSFCPPTEEDIQETAESCLPHGASLADLTNLLADLA